MNNFEELRNYLDNKITEINNTYNELVNDKGETIESLNARLEEIKDVLKGLRERVSAEDVSSMVENNDFNSKLSSIIHEYMPTVDDIHKMYNDILRISKMKLNDPQVMVSRDTVKDFVKRFESYVKDYEDKIVKLKRDIDSKKEEASREYRRVLDIINRGEYLSLDELNLVIDFINGLNLSDSVKLEFIINVSISNVELRERYESSKTSIEDTLLITAVEDKLQKVYDDKSSSIEKAITPLSDETSVSTLEQEVIPAVLNNRKTKDLKKIRRLRAKLEEIYGNDEYLPLYREVIDGSELSLSSRRVIYDSNGSSKWGIIYVDLCSLLNMEYTSDNVGEIFAIYKHILNEYKVYNEENEKKNSTKNSRQGRISSGNLNAKERANYDKELNAAIVIYETCSNENTLDDDYWDMVSLLGDAISNFRSLYGEYKAAFELASNTSINEEEFEIVKEDIWNIVKRLRSAYPEFKNDVDSFSRDIREFGKSDSDITLDNIDESILKNGKNFVIFLPYRGEECGTITYDHKEILDTDKKCVSYLTSGLISLYNKDYILGITQRDHKLLPPKQGSGIANYSEEVSPRIYRNNDVRFTYSYVSLSQHNRDLLKKEFGNDNDVKVILVIGSQIKHGNKREVGSIFNKRIANSIKDIRDINSLFYEDFSIENFERAKGLITHSYDIISSLKKEPTQIINRGEAR